jgi:hypothetical protein
MQLNESDADRRKRVSSPARGAPPEANPRKLRAIVVAAGAIVLALPVRTDASVEAASHLTLFREPSSSGGSVQVVHPQTDVSASVGQTVSLNAGYEVDLVTGATPAVYGSAQPDAVTGATRFSDTRQQTRGGVSIETPLIGLGASYSYGWERDYRSHTLSVSARGDFLERNFTLGLAYTRNFDSVCDQNNETAQTPLDRQPLTSADHCFHSDQPDVATHSVAVHTFEPSLVWTATPRLLVQLGGTVQVIDGFQSSPYRRVVVGSEGRTPQEHVPDLRQRFAGVARGRLALPELRAAVSALARLYRDTWDLRAVTAEGEVEKYLGPSLIIGARGRYHHQSGVVFFRYAEQYRTLGPVGQYWTGDRELAPLDSMLAGLKLTYLRRPERERRGWLDELELNVRFDALFYHAPSGAPSADRHGAYVTQAGVALRF